METEGMNSIAIDATEARKNAERLSDLYVSDLEEFYRDGESWATPISGDHLNRATITG